MTSVATMMELAACYQHAKSQRCLEIYDQLFARLRDEPISLLEVGAGLGGSLRVWQSYFRFGRIYGADLEPTRNADVPVFRVDQCDRPSMDVIGRQAGPFDIVIDDAAHVAAAASACFDVLFYHYLKPGGLYAIEDWGTGYWADWPDGYALERHAEMRFPCQGNLFCSHQSGMVGWVKQLVDECGLPDATNEPSFICSLTIYRGLVIVEKA